MDVRLCRTDELGSLEDLPKNVKDEVDGDADIRGHEFVDVPRTEDIKAVEDDDDGEEDERKVSGVWLEK